MSLRCAGCGQPITNGETPTYRILASGKRCWHQGCEPSAFPELPPKRPLMMEQCTLDVPDGHLARRFYVHGLGGLECAPTDDGTQAAVDLKVNAGASQLVLQLQTSYEAEATAVTAAAVLAGHIALWTREPLEEVHARLEAERAALAPALEAFAPHLDPQPEAKLLSGADGAPSQLVVTCPYGNQFVVSAPVDTPARPFRVIGQQPGGYAGLVAMPRILRKVRPGAAARVHSFLTRALGISAALEAGGDGNGGVEGSNGGEGGASSSDQPGQLMNCVVIFASGQQLIFQECEGDEAPPEGGQQEAEAERAAEQVADEEISISIAPPMNVAACAGSIATYRPRPTAEAAGYQMTLYLSSPEAFRTAFRGANELGAVASNPRYAGAPPHDANAESWSSAASAAVQQFRVRDLVCPTTGELGARMNLTIRSPLHACFPFPDVKGSIVEPPGFAQSLTPLPQPTHPAKPGFVRVPYGRGYFGLPAQELARQKQQQAGLTPTPPPPPPDVQLVHASEMASAADDGDSG